MFEPRKVTWSEVKEYLDMLDPEIRKAFMISYEFVKSSDDTSSPEFQIAYEVVNVFDGFVQRWLDRLEDTK
jgi:hypothetical protein